MRGISTEVLAVLDQSECRGNALKLAGSLDRKLYHAVNKVIVAAGGKWSKRERQHVFDRDALKAIEQIILTGGVGPKQELGQFDTPAPVAARIIALADLVPGMSVLEPSAGIGRLALCARAAGAGVVVCVEIDDHRCRALVDAGFSPVINADFLALEPVRKFDRVVMNPTFAGQADIDHVMAAERWLLPGRPLVAVMSASIRFRSNRKTEAFRAWLDERQAVIEDLPAGSFKASGTAVSACIVKLYGRGA